MSAVTEADFSSLILHRTKQTQLHIKRSVATRVRRYFIHQMKKKIKTNKSGRYMHIFGYLWKHTGQTGNQAVCCQNTVMSRQRRNGEHTLPWTTDFPCSWDNRNPTPSSSSGALCTSEWGSISSCWQTRLQSILEEEAAARSVAGFSPLGPPRREDRDQVRMSQIDLFSPLTWTSMIRQ